MMLGEMSRLVVFDVSPIAQAAGCMCLLPVDGIISDGDRGQHGDDGYYYQDLDQGETPVAGFRTDCHSTISGTGWVPETAPHFRRARVFVSPLRYGSGMKGKIGEALSLGVPVVTTTIGAEGMDLVHGETALIRDDPESFAADVARLFADDDLWVELVRNGRCHIGDNFGPDAVKRRLEKILAAVLG